MAKLAKQTTVAKKRIMNVLRFIFFLESLISNWTILRKKIKAIGAIGDAESPTLEILIGFAKPPEGICWNGNIWYRFLFEQSLEMGTKHFLVKFCYTIKLFDILIREHNLSICIVVMLNKVDIDTITDMSTSNPCAGRTIIFKDRKIFSGPQFWNTFCSEALLYLNMFQN